MIKLLSFVSGFLFATTSVICQDKPSPPEDELSLTLKIVSGKIIYGKDAVYVTEPQSIYLQPGLRYDFPIKISSRRQAPTFVSITGQAGFLFCKAEMLDPLVFRTRNPTYFILSSGIYTASSFSIGTEIFFWKGLGCRDSWGLKFPSLGYNGKNLRLYLAAEHYRQLIQAGNRGTVFALEFGWKLVK